MQANTTLVMLESPTNPRMQICDVRALCAIAHQAGRPSVLLLPCRHTMQCMGCTSRADVQPGASSWC